MPAPKNSSIKGFFQTHFDPYYIYAPDYQHSSAGVRSLHYLCHALNELGCEAYIAPGTRTNPALRTPVLSPEILKNHFLAGKTPIAVQPETVGGNFFETPHVAHWLLNRPGHLGTKTSYEDKLVFFFSEWTLPPGINAELLTLPLMDVAIFNNEDNPYDTNREIECYYAHKYLGFGHEVPLNIQERAISLCQNIPRTPTQIADILRKSRVLYCYEETALIAEALLCGCPVLMMPSDYLKKNNWRPQWIPEGAGWADEPEALDRITRATSGCATSEFRNKYETSHTYCWNTVQNFISLTHRAFTLRERKEALVEPTYVNEKLWNLPQQDRGAHLNEFLAAYENLTVFSHLQRSTPVLELAHWLKQSVATTSTTIPPHEAPSPTPITPPPVQPFSPKEESTLLTKITSLMAAGQSDKATPLLARLVAHDTLRWEVYDTLGQLYVEQNKLDEAAPVLLQGAALEFSSTHCLRKLAAAFAMRGDVWRTLATCTQILKREPDDQELHLFVRDVLVSTSPRFDDISWLAPEWTEAMDALTNYKGQAQAARSLLDNLQAKARAVLEEHHPLKHLGNRPLPRKQKSR